MRPITPIEKGKLITIRWFPIYVCTKNVNSYLGKDSLMHLMPAENQNKQLGFDSGHDLNY